MILSGQNNEKIFFDVKSSPFSILNIIPEVLLTKNDKLKLNVEKYAPTILMLLSQNKEGLTTSQLATKMDIDFEEAHFIVLRLMKDGRVRAEK